METRLSMNGQQLIARRAEETAEVLPPIASIRETPMYPLRFAPLYQYRLWGGRRLSRLLSARLPGDYPIGEAWLLSDRDDHASLVADGPLKGSTINQLLMHSLEQMLGKLSGHFNRFPLLLKLLDVSKILSVQVHPSDFYPQLLPAGDTGKTEAWVVLEAGPDARIYAGLKPATSAEFLRQAILGGTLADQLTSRSSLGWNRRSQSYESRSFGVISSASLESEDRRRLSSGQSKRHVYWCVSTARVRWSTLAGIMPSAKAMCSSCPL